MIRLWLGKAHSGKTYNVYQALRSAVLSGKSHETLLIVPEQYTLEAEKQLLQTTGLKGVLGLEILSIKRLVHKILKEVGGEEFVHITETGKRMLLRKLFQQHLDTLVLYKKTYDKSGFIESFYDLIQQLKAGMITVDDLDQITHKIDSESILYFKLQDLKTIYSAYLSVQKTGYYDDEDLNHLLMSLIPKSKWLAQSTIYIDGFDSFTNQEYEILGVLASHSKNMILSLTFDSNALNPHNHTLRAIERFTRIADEKEISLIKEYFERESPNLRIEHIASQIMTYPYKSKSFNDDSLHCFSAGSIQSEVAYCAVEILKCIKDRGYRWKDIAVVSNALNAYEPIIQRIFSQHEIPVFLDSKSSVMTNPLVHFILSASQHFIDHKSHQHLMRFLKTGLLSFELDDIFAFELYIKSNGLNLFKPFEKKTMDGFSLEQIETLRENLSKSLLPLKEIFTKKHFKIKEGVLALYNLLVSYNVYEQMLEKVEVFNGMLDYDEAQRFTQMWNSLMSLFDELVTLLGDDEVELIEFIKILETGLESVEVGRLPLDENCVLIGNLDRSKAHPIKVLFVLGVNDGILPESGGDAQLIQDREKEIMAQMGFKILADNQMFLDKESFNIYMTFSRPSERLYISYARSDSEGQTLRPSYLISKLQKIDTSLKIIVEKRDHLDTAGRPYWISSKVFTAHHLASAMRRAVDGYDIHPDWFEVFSWYAKWDKNKANHLLEGLSHSNSMENLSKNLVETLYKTPIKTSVSRLEEFVQCPFKFFVSSGLKPKTIKTYSIDYPDVGILFHSTLEAFGKKIMTSKENWADLSDDVCDSVVENLVDGIVDQDIFRSKFAYQYMVQKLKRVSKRAIKTLTYQLRQGAFEPIAYEMLFSDGVGGVPPIIIELANGQSLLLRGVIDRVDLLKTPEGDFIKIIDYKSGTKAWSLTDVYYGLQMQLMIYLKACLGSPEYFKAGALYPAGAFYFRIDDPLIESTEQVKEKVISELQGTLKMDGLCLDSVEVLRNLDLNLYEQGGSDVIKVKLKNNGEFTKDSKVVDLEHFNALMIWVESMIREIGNSLLSGYIKAYPCRMGQFVSCTYCSYGALCQFDTRFEGNDYKTLNPMDDESVLKAIENKEVRSNVDE